jgi:hypothetical protein
MDKLAAIWSVFRDQGMLSGSVIDHMACQAAGNLPPALPWNRTAADEDDSSGINEQDVGPAFSLQMETIVWLAARHCKFQRASMTDCSFVCSEHDYPTGLATLAAFINQPDFPSALREYIHQQNHLNSNHSSTWDDLFDGPIHVFHSATIQSYMPSDLCGAGGMHREVLCANPSDGRMQCFDTVLISIGDNNDCAVIQGLLVVQVWLFFSYFDPYHKKDIPYALVTWFVHPGNNPEHDKEMGMWKVVPKHGANDE